MNLFLSEGKNKERKKRKTREKKAENVYLSDNYTNCAPRPRGSKAIRVYFCLLLPLSWPEA